MTIIEIANIANADIICGEKDIDNNIKFAFASDLMSDVLTQDTEDLLLITGLVNIQTIRTVEMANIKCILFVRNKQVTKEMISLAQELQIVLLQSKFSMYHVSGLLFNHSLTPIF